MLSPALIAILTILINRLLTTRIACEIYGNFLHSSVETAVVVKFSFDSQYFAFRVKRLFTD